MVLGDAVAGNGFGSRLRFSLKIDTCPQIACVVRVDYGPWMSL